MARPKRTCTVDECQRAHRARGFCNMHLQRALKDGPIPGGPTRNWIKAYDDESAPCSITGCAKVHYSSGMCKKHYTRAAVFRLTCMQMDALSRVGICSICERSDEFANMHIDHDHACCPAGGKTCGRCVRGLICRRCNMGIGLFGDSPMALERAAKYLRS